MNLKKRYKPAYFIRRLLPEKWILQWTRRLENSFKEQTVSGKENARRLEEFQLRQISIAICGIIAILLVSTILFIRFYRQEELHFYRNSFGKGDQEILLQLEGDGKKKDYYLLLEEEKLTPEEEKEMLSDFIKDLKKEILGKNKSWNKINQPLNLVDSLGGYPFDIDYEMEDPDLIDFNGKPGSRAQALSENESLHTWIQIRANYKQYEYVRKIRLTMIAPKKKSKTIFEKWEKKIAKKEEDSRTETDFVIHESSDNISVHDPSSRSILYLPVLMVGATLLLLFQGKNDLRNQAKVRKRENMEDFPVIVHLLSLYMGAGLSFPSAVGQISRDYKMKQRKKKQRFAFEQIIVMDHCMNMGMRPREACSNWSGHFHEKVYAKFAMLLMQSFSKGAREINNMMEKEQQNAFQVQVDYVRRAGEEATTKLLFPMIILLMIIMLIIMFPAVMQFYTF